MKLSYTIEDRDYVDAYEFFWPAAIGSSKRVQNLGRGLILLGAFALIPFHGFWPIFVVIICVGVLVACIPMLRKRIYRRRYYPNAIFGERIEAELCDQGINFAGGTENMHYDWQTYTHVIETDYLFLLMITKMTFTIVPKRAFGSGSRRDQFRALVEQNVGTVTTFC